MSKKNTLKAAVDAVHAAVVADRSEAMGTAPKPKRKRAERVESGEIPKAPRSGEDEAAAIVGEMLDSEPDYDTEGYPIGTDENDMDPEALADLKKSGSLEDAAAALETLLGDPDGDDLTDPDSDDDSEDSDDDDSEDDADDDDADDDADDDDSEDDGDQTRVHEFSDDDLDAMVEVKINGQVEQVSLREALAGHMRHKAFTQKTTELAEQRRGVQQKEAEALENAHLYATNLAALDQFMGQHLPAPIRASIQQQVQQEAQRLRAVQEQAVHEHLTAEKAKLTEAFGWQNDQEAAQGRAELRAFAQEYGFSDDDLASALDHRVLVVLRDAGRYRAMQARRGEVREEVKGKRKQSPTLTPGTRGKRADPAKKAHQSNRKRLKQTGRVDDAAAALVGMLGEDF